jgi:hypothetical protein
LSAGVQDGVGFGGGVVGYPLDQMREEVACIAMHFHWSLESLLEMEHGDRRQWVRVIARQLGEAGSL